MKVYKTIIIFFIILFLIPLYFFGTPIRHPLSKKPATNTYPLAPSSSGYTYTYAPFSKEYKVSKGVSYIVDRSWLYPKITWFFIHNSELDAQIVLDWAASDIGGTSLQLVNLLNPQKRDIIFRLKNKGDFSVDPNRIFSRAGIKKNILILNKIKYQSTLRHAVNVVWNNITLPSIRILRAYWTPIHPMIALHNNNIIDLDTFADPTQFTIAHFDKNEPTSFVFVTRYRYFELLKSCGINTVYQRKPSYDGSLSDYAIFHSLPYVNIETHMGNLEVQKNLAFKVAYILFSNLFNKRVPNAQLDLCGNETNLTQIVKIK